MKSAFRAEVRFNWQTSYRFAEPKRVAGTRILCTGGFDNSTRNPIILIPLRMSAGRSLFDEMFIGFMSVAEVPAARKAQAKRESRIERRRAPPALQRGRLPARRFCGHCRYLETTGTLGGGTLARKDACRTENGLNQEHDNSRRDKRDHPDQVDVEPAFLQ
jgi:hypothetical protein